MRPAHDIASNLLTQWKDLKITPLFLSMAAFDGNRTTITLLLVDGQCDEYKRAADEYGIACATWSSKSSTSDSQLLLVSPGDTSWPDLQIYTNGLLSSGRLARIVIDGAHKLLLPGRYRDCLDFLVETNFFAVPLLLITVALPRNLEPVLLDKVNRRVYKVVRCPADRSEIAHKMIAINRQYFEDEIVTRIKALVSSLRGQQRCVLFCRSYQECNQMADKLGWKSYTSIMSLQQRNQAIQVWLEGDTRGLVSVSGECYLDYPQISVIFHLGVPENSILYVEANTLHRRNGGCTDSYVFFDPTEVTNVTGEDHFGKGVVHDTLSDNTTCRRLRIFIFLDGVATPCVMLPRGQLCDVCDAESQRNSPVGGPPRFPAHLLPATESTSANAATLSGSSSRIPSSPTTQSGKEATTCQEIFESEISKRILQDERLEVDISDTLASEYLMRSELRTSDYARLSDWTVPSRVTNDPFMHPAPIANFGSHFAAAQASLIVSPPPPLCLIARKIAEACRILSKSCVACWALSLHYHSHSLAECPFTFAKDDHPMWRDWTRHLRLPVNHCFYCGCPQVRHFPAF